MNALSSEKHQIRQEFARRRLALTADERRHADAAICRRLAYLSELCGCRLLAAFVPFGPEPDLRPFWREFLTGGGRLFLPRSRREGATVSAYEMASVTAPERQLSTGAFGIPEPNVECSAATAAELAAMTWLAPGVAFDAGCRRLGRGKGFYDRLLGLGPGLKIGIFYECQQIAAVPVEDHDRPLDLVVTEGAVYRPNYQERRERA